MNSITIAKGPGLADLARQINAEHAAVTEAFGNALHHARRAGDLLIDAKSRCPHGGWLPWLEANCKVSERTARLYRQIAREWPRLEANRQRAADLSLRQAVAVLAPPQKTPKAVISTPGKPVTIDGAAREVAPQSKTVSSLDTIPAPNRPTPATVSNLRREPTQEERAKDQARGDLAEYVTGSIRAWMRAHPEHDADGAVDLACEALALLKSEIEDGGVKIT